MILKIQPKSTNTSSEISDSESNASQETQNKNVKKRARRGAATDPQSLYARVMFQNHFVKVQPVWSGWHWKAESCFFDLCAEKEGKNQWKVEDPTKHSAQWNKGWH